MGSHDKRLRCVLDCVCVGDLGMRIKVEVTQEELDECEFTGVDGLMVEIIQALDDARDFPGFNVEVEIVDE